MSKDELRELLKAELKAEGVELAEESAKAAFKAILRVIPKFIVATKNPYDDLLLAVLPVLEPKVLELLDQINKADNE
jgi:hypothetical protein